MDAYNAYFSQDEEKCSPNIINNIMHINHPNANINITTGQNCHNNFIFNHTAPINLNFYNEKEGGKTDEKDL